MEPMGAPTFHSCVRVAFRESEIFSTTLSQINEHSVNTSTSAWLIDLTSLNRTVLLSVPSAGRQMSSSATPLASWTEWSASSLSVRPLGN